MVVLLREQGPPSRFQRLTLESALFVDLNYLASYDDRARTAHRLGLLVKAKGLTQKSVADTMGVSEQTLSRYLQGKSVMGADTLEQLMSALGINLGKVVDAEVAKVMKAQERKQPRRRSLISELQEEQLAKVVDWYSRTSRK